jgi:hypothetical protein
MAVIGWQTETFSDHAGNTVDYRPLPMTPELFERRHDNLVYAMITAEDVEMRWIYYYKLKELSRYVP